MKNALSDDNGLCKDVIILAIRGFGHVPCVAARRVSSPSVFRTRLTQATVQVAIVVEAFLSSRPRMYGMDGTRRLGKYYITQQWHQDGHCNSIHANRLPKVHAHN